MLVNAFFTNLLAECNVCMHHHGLFIFKGAPHDNICANIKKCYTCSNGVHLAKVYYQVINLTDYDHTLYYV